MTMHPGPIDEFGQRQRELPSNIDAEQALLGAMLVNNDAFHAVSDHVEAKQFDEPLHGLIFETIGNLVRQDKGANPVTLKPYLPNGMVGDLTMAQYLARLARDAVTIAGAPNYADAIRFAALRRDLIGAGQMLEDLGYDVASEIELLDHIDAVHARLAEIVAGLSGREQSDGLDVAQKYLEKLAAKRTEGQGIGVPMCLPELETVLSERAFQPKRLYGLLSSSGEGKTSLTLQIIYRALQSNHPVLFLSYDQTHEECIGQMAAQHLGIELRRQQNRSLSEKEIEQCYSFAVDLGKLPFDVIDCTNENADKLATYATTFLKRKGNGKTPLIVIDHIGTIRPDDARADEGTKARNIAQRLKALAKATSSAVLVLQQRSGAGMKRPNPRPIAADLFGGEAARQPFDSIFYLYRAEEHMRKQIETAIDANDEEKIRTRFRRSFGQDVEGKAEIGVLKARFSDPSIKRVLDFDARHTRYISKRQQEEGLGL